MNRRPSAPPVLVALLVLSVCSAGCGSWYFGDGHLAFMENAHLDIANKKVGQRLPEGVDGATAKATPDWEHPRTLALKPGDAFTLKFEFEGGPIDQLNVGSGEQYFEIPIDLSKAGDDPTATTDPAEIAAINAAKAASQPSGTIELTGKLDPGLDLPDALDNAYLDYQVRGTDGQLSYSEGSADRITLCTKSGDCEEDVVEDPPVTGDGSGTGSGTGGGSGGTSGVTWKDTWRFVQSDKAVRSRLALSHTDGNRHYLQIQYQVNTGDGIYCAGCTYHVYASANGYKYRVNVPQSAYASNDPNVGYTLPKELWIDLDGVNFKWDETNRQVVNAQGVPEEFPWSCADDDSTTSRCADTFEPVQDVFP